ncbi:hypothetical protein ACF0H5_005094 [Mactra antiquata]
MPLFSIIRQHLNLFRSSHKAHRERRSLPIVSEINYWRIELIMNRLSIFVLVSALLIVSSYGRPNSLSMQNMSPKLCLLVTYRRLEHCDMQCTTRFGEGRLGENLYYYKQCLEDCAISYVDRIADC